MDKILILKKSLSVFVILLLIGVTFSLSINSKVIKNNDENLVKIEVEICGTKDNRYAVLISKEDIENVDKLFEDIRSRLEKGADTKEVFNDAVIQLERYGLLKGIRVKEAQTLVTNNKNKVKTNQLGMNNENYDCEIVGTAYGRFYSSTLLCDKLVTFLLENAKLFDPTGKFVGYIYRMANKIRTYCFIYDFFKSNFIPVRYSTDISLGYCHFYNEGKEYDCRPTNGWIWTNGTNGVKSWEGDMFGKAGARIIDYWDGSNHNYIGVKEFTGICFGGKYFGHASHVKIKIGQDPF